MADLSGVRAKLDRAEEHPIEFDHLVWQLVLAAGRRPGRRTGFPVVRRAKDWEVQSRTALHGVEQQRVDEIELVEWVRETVAHFQPAFRP